MKTKLLKAIRKRFIIKQDGWRGYYFYDKKNNTYHRIPESFSTNLTKEIVKIMFDYETSRAMIMSNIINRLNNNNKIKFKSL